MSKISNVETEIVEIKAEIVEIKAKIVEVEAELKTCNESDKIHFREEKKQLRDYLNKLLDNLNKLRNLQKLQFESQCIFHNNYIIFTHILNLLSNFLIFIKCYHMYPSILFPIFIS